MRRRWIPGLQQQPVPPARAHEQALVRRTDLIPRPDGPGREQRNRRLDLREGLRSVAVPRRVPLRGVGWVALGGVGPEHLMAQQSSGNGNQPGIQEEDKTTLSKSSCCQMVLEIDSRRQAAATVQPSHEHHSRLSKVPSPAPPRTSTTSPHTDSRCWDRDRQACPRWHNHPRRGSG